jgi:hypothetical protein
MTPGYFQLPGNPIGMGDMVRGGFPLPNNPVGYVQAGNGSLPKAYDLTMDDLALEPASDSEPCAGMGGCGCSSCGMGDLMLGTFNVTQLIPGQLIAGIPNTYLAAGVLLAAFLFMGGRRGRR